MDLQGIALVVTTSVAVVGVPCTLLIGRWQLRAALQTAGATHQAGLRQAETAYQAALDTVRAQSDSAHDQWLRGVRREACSVFLLAIGELVGILDQVLDSTGVPDSLRPANRDLQRALAVLELEGDAELVGAAQELVACCDEIAEAALSSSFAARTWRALYARQVEERNAVTRREQSSTPVTDAVNALLDLQVRLAGMRDAYTAVEAPPGVRPGTISALGHYVPRGGHPFESIGEAYAAVRHVYETAVQFLERTDLPREEAAVLLRDAVHEGRVTVLDYMTGQSTRLTETRRTFLSAARHALGNHSNG
ncbi:hypothetical protein PZB75_00055 [Streptomyces sp. AM 4-1-1]|uniref:hypothetical protein n=1 Tax=Streptomyces sp. AM 4-1-1 TaxID=3028710 RepID=UPI0023B8C141|nr:hypothetical protein [Streptomyces sp. AM 4-1-1]WEH31913.1 hypothetical protein PZB75_00055 [Streptomyces sp. AM 4-1-1]